MSQRLKLLCLNPCFSGGWSQRATQSAAKAGDVRLNPCFSGGWSQSTPKMNGKYPQKKVLILVLVEDGLRDQQLNNLKNNRDIVLILVLVEDGLRALEHFFYDAMGDTVLILVLVEDGLRGQNNG